MGKKLNKLNPDFRKGKSSWWQSSSGFKKKRRHRTTFKGVISPMEPTPKKDNQLKPELE